MVMGLIAVASCASQLEVSGSELGGAAATMCSALDETLPDSVAGQTRREVTSQGVASAWGAPAIVLRCGVSDAVGLDPTSRCEVVDGVGWYTEALGEAYRFTTIGRAVPVEVIVPDAYAPEADALIDLASAVRETIPRRRRCV
ncbi:hypothetical protein BH18ACT8_BH18ACT8_05390 [soil metagenome]